MHSNASQCPILDVRVALAAPKLGVTNADVEVVQAQLHVCTTNLRFNLVKNIAVQER